MPTEDVLRGLAKELIEKWSRENPDVWGPRKAGKEAVADGLRQMITGGIMNAATIAGGDKVAVAIAGIKAFQLLAGLRPDGIFGNKTVKKMFNFRGCDETEGRGKPLADGSISKIMNERVSPISIFYHIRDGFPEVPRGCSQTAKKMIKTAWFRWASQDVGVFARLVDDEKDANVVIRWGRLDGNSGSKLGEADVGGPHIRDRQLELVIDEDEDWTDDRFLYCACHEIGHILGLKHADGAGQLMSPFLDSSINKPQENDLARMKALWDPTG